MRIYFYNELMLHDIESLCKRNISDDDNILKFVLQMKENIKLEKESAIIKYAQKFDNHNMNNLYITDEEYNRHFNISEKLKNAIDLAISNINKFHLKQVKWPAFLKTVITSHQIKCWKKFHAIDNVGLYIPKGLFSTALMTIIPAKIAGCENIVICTPPNKNGKIDDVMLYVFKKLGIRNIYKIGGAQAIFAMNYGYCVPKVDKIYGPGNNYVNIAKKIISMETAIDMPAGPSEICVIADSNSDPNIIAFDLLSQAEHGPNSQILLLSDDIKLVTKVIEIMKKEIQKSNKKEIISSVISNSYSVITHSIYEAIFFSNRYAPEHLVLYVDRWKDYVQMIKNTGSVFCGKYTSESLGDYISGTNHVLPTSGFAKSFSALSVEDFGTWTTFQYITKNSLSKIANSVEELALAENLEYHAMSIKNRVAK